jgi:hypothetical protein
LAHLLHAAQETAQDFFAHLVVVFVVGVRLPKDFSMDLLEFVDFFEQQVEFRTDSSMQFILLVRMGVDSRFADFYFHLLLLLVHVHVAGIFVQFFYVFKAVFVQLCPFVDLLHPFLEFAALEGGTHEVLHPVVLLVLFGEEGREKRRTDDYVVVGALPHLAVSAGKFVVAQKFRHESRFLAASVVLMVLLLVFGICSAGRTLSLDLVDHFLD